MHSLLIPHHHPGCLEVMQALEECHAKGFMWKAVGMCNKQKRELNKCFAQERAEKKRVKLAAAREKRKKLEETWAEWDRETS